MDNKYYGKYRAIVKDINDPERRGRIRVQCPSVLGDYLSAWCEPCIPYATDFAGDFYVPPINEGIWVEFEEGDANKPIWNGGWYKPDSSPLLHNDSADKYRYLVFKDSVMRMGEREFIFELRDESAGKSYTVTISPSTWMGLNYISSKNQEELTSLENLILNKDFILTDFPKQVDDNFKIIEDNLKSQGDQFNQFVNAVTDQFNSIHGMFDAQDSLNSEMIHRIEELEKK